MYITVQSIHTTWSKAARGGRIAQLRAIVPDAFSLQSENLKVCNGIYAEEQHWGENNDFQKPIIFKSYCEPSDVYTFQCAQVRRGKNEAFVDWTWDWWQVGAPERTPAHYQLTIHLDEWLQLRWNGRFSCVDSGTWRYGEVTLNVACTWQRPTNNFFTKTTPTSRRDLRASLR